MEDTILIQNENEAGKEYWFAGGIYQLEMVVEDGIYYVVVEGISRSYELDIHPESRSFQNKGATYTHVIKQLVQGHPKGDAQNEATDPDAVIGEFIVQYQETNWQFMKRLASRVGTVILPDLVMDAPRIYFGVPDYSWGKDMKAYSYTMVQDMGSYLSYQSQAAGDATLHLLMADCIQYRVKSKLYYQVGDNVGFKRQIWVIHESVITYEQGSIQYEYVLVQRKAIRRKSKVNQAIQGVALEGRVVNRANNMVKVHLDIDDQHDEAGNWWFPYSAEGNNIFHSLPDEGAKIKVYFPSGIEKKAIAINSSRGASEEMISRTVFQKPTTKVFHIPGNTKMELGEDGVLFEKDTVKINLEGGNIQVEATEDLLLTVANQLELLSQKEKAEEKDRNQSKSAARLPRSIKFTAKNMIAMQILEDQFMVISNAFVAIRSKKIDFNKVDIPFVDMLTEDELKELYVEELFEQDKALVQEIYQEKWKEKKEKASNKLVRVEVNGEEIKAGLRDRVNEDPHAIKNAKARLGEKDQNELQVKYLTRGKPQDNATKPEEKSEEELAKIKNSYVTRYSQTHKLMSASYRAQNAETDEERTEAFNQYLQVFGEMQQSGFFANDAEGQDELTKYFSKNVTEMLYYSRFNFERIVIAGQYGSVLMGVFGAVTGLIAAVASIPSAGTSIIIWSLIVGDVLWSAGQMYVSLEKLDDLGKGYGYTDPEVLGLNQSDLDKLGLFLAAANLSLLAKHGVTKLLDSATDASRIRFLNEVAKREKNFEDIINRLNKRIEFDEQFELRFKDKEISDIINSGKALGLDDRTIEDLMFTASRVKKPINAEELIKQMENYVNVVMKRKFPYKFDSIGDYISFKGDLNDLLKKYNISTNDIRIQGSSVRTPNANDVDIAIVVKKEEFDKLYSEIVEGLKDRIKKPSTRKKLLRDLEKQVESGRINSFYFNRIEDDISFNQQLYELIEHTNLTESPFDLSIVVKGSEFDLYPYIN
ncbi:hypothetical protein [Paenibacillus lentus]|uniref:hypothetical protein n=1 Tax=Paenibacillus lentus TaxID=1338368 RepID=UPI0013DE05C1|nr:hypothetical protein [Paenibacillus lentus]